VSPPSTGRRRGRPPSGGREAILGAALALLSERGATRLTTREVAERAGLSEGSVFYHFTDRTGLLTAVLEHATGNLVNLAAEPSGRTVRETLHAFATGVERFLADGLVALVAAQSDADLRAALAAFLAERDYGPHRGVGMLAGYLRSRQAAGEVRADADCDAVAFLVVGSCFLRVAQRQMIGDGYFPDSPTVADLAGTLDRLLAPSATP
jgi:AcrR family transcriptional regulator